MPNSRIASKPVFRRFRIHNASDHFWVHPTFPDPDPDSTDVRYKRVDTFVFVAVRCQRAPGLVLLWADDHLVLTEVDLECHAWGRCTPKFAG